MLDVGEHLRRRKGKMFVTELLGSFRTIMGGYLWNKAIEYIGVYISPNLRENAQVGLRWMWPCYSYKWGCKLY